MVIFLPILILLLLLLLLLLLQHLFNGLFSRTTRVSWHQQGKPFWILLEREMMGWQWHQLDHMQIISLQTDNHTCLMFSIQEPMVFHRLSDIVAVWSCTEMFVVFLINASACELLLAVASSGGEWRWLANIRPSSHHYHHCHTPTSLLLLLQLLLLPLLLLRLPFVCSVLHKQSETVAEYVFSAFNDRFSWNLDSLFSAQQCSFTVLYGTGVGDDIKGQHPLLKLEQFVIWLQ